MGGCISKDKDDGSLKNPNGDTDSEDEGVKRSQSGIKTATFLTQRKTKSPEFDQGLAELHIALAQQWVSPDQCFNHIVDNQSGFFGKQQFQQALFELKLNWWWTKYGETIWQILDDDGTGQIGAAKFQKFMRKAKLTQEKLLATEVSNAGCQEFEVTDETSFVAIIAMTSTMTVCQQFVRDNLEFFMACPLVTTAGTAEMLESVNIKVAKKVHAGKVGGHQEIGDLVCTKRVAAVIFFRDPLAITAEHCDTQALIRVCDVHQIPLATNPGTAKGVLMFLNNLGLEYRVAQNKDSVLAKYKASRAAVIAKVQVAGSEAGSRASAAPAAPATPAAPTEAEKVADPSPKSSGSPSSSKPTLARSKSMTPKDEVTLNDGLATLYKALSSKWVTTKTLFKHLDPSETGKIDKHTFETWLDENDLGLWWEMFGPFIWSIFDEDDTGAIDLDNLTTGMERAEQAYYQTIQEQAKRSKKITFTLPPPSEETRYVSLVAHDEMKPSMMKFVEDNLDYISTCPLVTTGTTGRSLEKMGLNVGKKVNSGPVGGDQEIAAMGCNGKVAAVFFFKDPLTALPHSADIEALVRVCDVHGIPYATNPGTAKGVIMALEVLGLQWREKAPAVQAAGITAAPIRR